MSYSYGPGPQLPPHDPNGPNDGDDCDAYGPVLPPHLAAKKKSQHAQQPTRRSPSPVTLPKTAPLKPSAPTVQEDSDSDDDFGPPPPRSGPSTTSNEDAIREFKEREQRRKELAEVMYLRFPSATFSSKVFSLLLLLLLPLDQSPFLHCRKPKNLLPLNGKNGCLPHRAPRTCSPQLIQPRSALDSFPEQPVERRYLRTRHCGPRRPLRGSSA